MRAAPDPRWVRSWTRWATASGQWQRWPGCSNGVGLNDEVEAVTVTIPWPGTEAYLDYRLSMASTALLVADERAVRQEAAAALASLAEDELDWHAAVIVGVGRRA